MGAAEKKATIEAHVSFALPGDKVALHKRVGDVAAAGDTPVKTATVRRDGRVRFAGLEVGAYFIIGQAKVHVAGQTEPRLEERAEAVNAKIVEDSGLGIPEAGVHPDPISEPEFSAQMRQQTSTEIVTGARTSANSRPRDARGHTPPADPIANEDDAQLRAEKGAQLASDTHAGVAVAATQPTLQQEDVPAGVKQASSTETGTAAPLPGELEKAEKAAAKRKRDAASRKRRAAAAKAKPKAAPKRKKAGVQSGRTGSAKKAQRQNAGQGAAGRAASRSRRR